MTALLLFRLLEVSVGLLFCVVGLIALKGLRWRLAAAVPLVVVAGYLAGVPIPGWTRPPAPQTSPLLQFGEVVGPPVVSWVGILFLSYYVTHRRTQGRFESSPRDVLYGGTQDSIGDRKQR